MNLPFLTFRIPEIEGMSPEQAHQILDTLSQHPNVRTWERFRVWGIRIPIALLIGTFLLYFTTRNWLPAELIIVIQTSVLSFSLVTIMVVLVTYKIMMTRTLRNLIQEHLDTMD
ncbi:MAG: hypothetical protein AAGA25_08535 [Planctomycetota bacterium]